MTPTPSCGILWIAVNSIRWAALAVHVGEASVAIWIINVITKNKIKPISVPVPPVAGFRLSLEHFLPSPQANGCEAGHSMATIKG